MLLGVGLVHRPFHRLIKAGVDGAEVLFLLRRLGLVVARERADQPPLQDRRLRGVNGAQFGQKRRRDLIALDQLFQGRRRLVADGGDGRLALVAQLGVLRAEAGQIRRQRMSVRRLGQRADGVELRRFVAARAKQCGNGGFVLERTQTLDGRDAHRRVLVFQQRREQAHGVRAGDLRPRRSRRRRGRPAPDS